MRIAVDHRTSILEASARLFARRPYHEVLMEDVARDVGVAKGTIYRHFPTKEDLFAAVSMWYLEMLEVETARVLETGGPPLQCLKQMLKRLIELLQEHSTFFQVMQRHECEVWTRQESRFTKLRGAIRDNFVGLIVKAQGQGELAVPFKPVIAADMLLGMMRNVLRYTQPAPTPEKLAGMAMHVFVHGLTGPSRKK